MANYNKQKASSQHTYSSTYINVTPVCTRMKCSISFAPHLFPSCYHVHLYSFRLLLLLLLWRFATFYISFPFPPPPHLALSSHLYDLWCATIHLSLVFRIGKRSFHQHVLSFRLFRFFFPVCISSLSIRANVRFPCVCRLDRQPLSPPPHHCNTLCYGKQIDENFPPELTFFHSQLFFRSHFLFT